MQSALPRTMKAIVTRGPGGFEMLDYCTVPVPQPARGEVLVRVTAAGLNNTDYWTREALYGTDRDPQARVSNRRGTATFPRIQGLDIAGRIAQVGAGVDPARVGQRVICNFVLYGGPPGSPGGNSISGALGSARDGGFAEFATLPAENAYDVGDLALTDAELATFPCAYLTAEHMLEKAGVAKGELVVVTGASGGAGSALLQLAHARGAETVAITSTPHLASVRALGPAHVVARDAGDVHDQVRAAIGDRPVDVAADVVGGTLFGDLLALLRIGGRYVAAGAIGGAVVPFDLRTMYLKYLTLYGVSIGYRHQFEAMLAHVRAGRVRPLLAATFPLSRFRDAQELFVSRKFFGNIVVLPGE